MFNILGGSNKGQISTRIQVTVQYDAPHWIVLIKNPGDKEWTVLRDNNKKVELFNDYGDLIKTRPAFRSFESAIKANEWISENMPQAQDAKIDPKDLAKITTRPAALVPA